MTAHYKFEFFQRDNDPDCQSFPVSKGITNQLEYDDTTTWCVVLENFLDFLGNVYGYDVRQSVQFKSLQEKIELMKNKYGITDDDDFDTEEGQEEEWRKIL